MPQYLRVVLDVPLRCSFDYLPADEMQAEKLQAGQRILVPFGRRKLVGLLLEVANDSPVAADKLKPAIKLLDENPILSKELIAFYAWIADYYHHSLGEVFACALPKLLRTGEPCVIEPSLIWRLADVDETTSITSTKTKLTPSQQEAIGILQKYPAGVDAQMLSNLQIAKSTVNALLAKNIVVMTEQQEELINSDNLLAEDELILNPEQAAAVKTISTHLQQFKPFLLYGVTGSGKTEIYLQLIKEVLAQGKQVLILIPEINLTPQTLSRFKARFNIHMVVLNSAISESERLNCWLKARDNKAQIIIGTRSAIFTPIKDLGLVIVDEEHDSSYKQQESLRYHARDLAIMRAKNANVPVVLGSATPSLESFYNAEQGRYQLLKLATRAANAVLPSFITIDIKGKKLNAGIADELKDQIAHTLAAQQQVLVFLNRRGFAPALLCYDCGHVHECPKCDARLVLHQKRNLLLCHHCGFSQTKPVQCVKCQSVQIMGVGAGTQRAEEALQEMFADYPIIRVDRDSVSTKKKLDAIFTQVLSGKPCILVGTQMLAKGHHFPAVTLVAILDVDGGLYSSDFRAPEKMAQMIMQVAGRSGREQQQGKVIIQTHLPHHELLQQLIRHGYFAFAEQALKVRMEADLPPCSFMALIRASAVVQDDAASFLQQIAEQAQSFNVEDVEILGPVAAAMAFRAGRYRMQLLLQSPTRGNLHNLLQRLIPNIVVSHKVRWSLDVDPIDLF